MFVVACVSHQSLASVALKFVAFPTPSNPVKVAVIRMRTVWIGMTRIHVRAVVRAIKESAVVGAVPKEIVVAVTRVVRQTTSVEMGSVVSSLALSLDLAN
jgi:hypothetical protein